MLQDKNGICLYCEMSSCEFINGRCLNCYEIEKLRSFKVALASSDEGFFEIDKITDKIYLGDYEGALRKEKLLEFGITHILVCGTFLVEFHPSHFKYMTIEIDDSDDQDIMQYFDKTNKFIDESDKVFIHCRAGISRSPSVTIAYLMWKEKIPFYKAFERVKKKRDIFPNLGFASQLIVYQNNLNILDINNDEFSSFKNTYKLHLHKNDLY